MTFGGYSHLFVEDIVAGSSHMDECLCAFAVILDAAELLHWMVPVVVDTVHALTFVAVAGLMLLLCNICDVYVVCRVEKLGLSSCHRLEEI